MGTHPQPRFPIVLLDLDRTLVDVEGHVDYCAALADLRASGFDGAGDLGPETSWGTCTRTVVDLLLSLPDGPARSRAERAVVPHELRGARAATPMPGLERLRDTLGTRPVAIVTLLSPPATEVVVDRFGLWDRAVVARRAGRRSKPHPDQLLAALEQLGAAPDRAVMVGDSERDAAAAAAAGTAFVGVTNGRDQHGFGPVHAVVEDLHGLATLLSEAGRAPG